jgi:hypothetical protein
VTNIYDNQQLLTAGFVQGWQLKTTNSSPCCCSVQLPSFSVLHRSYSKKSLPQNTKTNGFAIPSLNQQARVLKPALFKINA